MEEVSAKPKPQAGIPLLTPELSKKLLAKARSSYLFDAQVAQACGVEPKTLQRWLLWGQLPDAKEPYKSFSAEYSKTQTTIESEAVAEVENAWQAGDWRAAAWYLERRWPQRYGIGKEQRTAELADVIDIPALVTKSEERQMTLVEAFKEPSPELVQAMRSAAQHILAILGAVAAPETQQLPAETNTAEEPPR